MTTILAAELLLLLTRSKEVVVLCKTTEQRTKAEQNTLRLGLKRSLLLESLAFVPASAILVSLLAPLLVPVPNEELTEAYHAAFGIASYGFPFAMIRNGLQAIALNALKGFASPRMEENE